MGHLQIKIGPLTRTLTIPDVPATAVALEVVERTSGPVEGARLKSQQRPRQRRRKMN